MTLHPDHLAEYLAAHPRLIQDQNITEARLFSFVVTGAFIYNMLEPAWYILSVPSSMIHKTAALAGPPWFVAALFVLTGILGIPKLYVDLIDPSLRECRLPRFVAVVSAIIASGTWAMMGNLSRPLDAGALHLIYWANAVGYMTLAGVYAKSLNVQQINEQSAPS